MVRATGAPSPARGPAPLTVSFSAYGSDDPSGDTIPDDNFFWYYSDTFGRDQVIGRGIIQTHEFTEPGEYKVYLTVRSRNADKGILDGSNVMRVIVEPKAANFRVYANGRELLTTRPVKIGENEAKQGVVIDGSTTTPVENRKILSHRRSVQGEGLNIPAQTGQGVPGSIRVPLPSLGTYTVFLTVTDNNGNTDTVQYQIVIEDPVSIINMTPKE